MYPESINQSIFNIIRWIDGPNDSLTKRLMFQVLFFFIISYKLRALKTLYFIFFVIKKLKINWKDFCKEFCEKLWKKKKILGTSDTWLMSRSSQQPSVLYWRLSDFWFVEYCQTSPNKNKSPNLWHITSCIFY